MICVNPPALSGAIKVGDTFTVAGVFDTIPNPTRMWFQFWKPRRVANPNPPKLSVFRVVSNGR